MSAVIAIFRDQSLRAMIWELLGRIVRFALLLFLLWDALRGRPADAALDGVLYLILSRRD